MNRAHVAFILLVSLVLPIAPAGAHEISGTISSTLTIFEDSELVGRCDLQPSINDARSECVHFVWYRSYYLAPQRTHDQRRLLEPKLRPAIAVMDQAVSRGPTAVGGGLARAHRGRSLLPGTRTPPFGDASAF